MVRQPAPPECIDCGKPMVPRGHEPEPGGVIHDAVGRCVKCRAQHRRNSNPRKRASAAPVACVACEHPLRPRHTSKADYEGTREHAGKGLCRVCEMRKRRGRIDAATLPAPVARTQQERAPKPPPPITDPGLLRAMRDRQARAERARRQELARRLVAGRQRTAA